VYTISRIIRPAVGETLAGHPRIEAIRANLGDFEPRSASSCRRVFRTTSPAFGAAR
jgi:hypothetical protein